MCNKDNKQINKLLISRVRDYHSPVPKLLKIQSNQSWIHPHIKKHVHGAPEGRGYFSPPDNQVGRKTALFSLAFESQSPSQTVWFCSKVAKEVLQCNP